MSITEIGRDGEKRARKLLKNLGCINIFQADWLVQKHENGPWYVVEVKQKERYEPPPFEGHGLNIYQVQMRLKFQKKDYKLSSNSASLKKRVMTSLG